MGLYDELPQSFAGANEQRLQRTAESAPGLYRSYLQDQGIKQENTDRAYNSPARAANPHEQHIGGYVQKLFGDAPPEWEQRFRAEMQPQYVTPSGPESGDHMTEPAYMGGYGLSAQPRTLALTPEQGPQVQRQGLQAPTAPMTHGDVQKYMSMAPLVQAENRQRKLDQQGPQRDYLGEIALRAALKGEEDRKTEREKQGGREGLQNDQQDWKTREAELNREHQWKIALLRNEAELERLERRIASGASSAWEIAQLKAEVSVAVGAMAAQSRELSSIPNLAKDKDLLAHNEEMEKRAKQALINAEKLKARGAPGGASGSMTTKQTTKSSSTNNQPTTGKVAVVNENGQTGTVAADKVEAWLKAHPKRKKR